MKHNKKYKNYNQNGGNKNRLILKKAECCKIKKVI